MHVNSRVQVIRSQICFKTLLRNRKPGQRTIIFFELSVTFLKLQIRFVFYVREKSYTSSVSGKHFVPYRNSWMRKTSMHSIRALTVHVRRPVKIHNNKEISNKTWRQMLPGLFDILQFHFHGQSRVLFRLQQQVHRDTASYLQCFCICFRCAI